MIVPDLIVRTRRRSMSLIVNDNGELIVRAPAKLSMDKIVKFVTEKEKWILSKQKLVKNTYEVNNDILTYQSALFLGKKYKIDKLNGVKKIEITNDSIICPPYIDEDKFKIKLTKWFIQMASEILKNRLEYFANLLQLDYSSFKLSNSKNRWGSCDSLGNIKLNYRVVMLPHNFIDYIVIHELTHLLYMNHSQEFYSSIECVMPSYKLYKNKLKEYNYILGLFR